MTMKHRHRRPNFILTGFYGGLVAILMCSLPVLGERFAMQASSATIPTTSSFNAPVLGLYHRLVWIPSTSVVACTVELDASLDGVSWSAIVGPVSCTTAGFATSTAVTTKYLRIVSSGTPGAAIVFGYASYDTNPSAAGSSVAVTNSAVGDAIPVRCVDPTGTAYVDCGGGGGTVTAAQGAAGGTAWPVTQSGAINVGTMPIVNVGTMPTINVGTMPNLSVTNTVAVHETAQITTVTVGQHPAVVQGGAGGTAWPVTLSASTVTVGQLPTVNVGTMPVLNVGTMPNLSVTNTLTVSPAASTTFVTDDIADGTIGSAVPTNGMFAAGAVRTDTIAKGGAGNMIGVQLDNQGRLVIAIAPPELQSSARAALTATTASQILASSGGANYKWAITFLSACNGSATIAGQVDITDSSGTLYSFPWTQTSSAPGEPRCYILPLSAGDPIFSAANTTISAKATVANATGFFINVAAHKTGT